jgi:hypothetical protein
MLHSVGVTDDNLSFNSSVLKVSSCDATQFLTRAHIFCFPIWVNPGWQGEKLRTEWWRRTNRLLTSKHFKLCFFSFSTLILF